MCARAAAGQILDPRAHLARYAWLDNRDYDWFAQRIPFFESPDEAVDATYYYRWEVVTKHLTYASPDAGYTFTEFIDHPFWSGAHGAISCPLGHQFSEVRWPKDRRVIDDFARYWFSTSSATTVACARPSATRYSTGTARGARRADARVLSQLPERPTT